MDASNASIMFALPCFTFWIYIFKMLSRKFTRV